MKTQPAAVPTAISNPLQVTDKPAQHWRWRLWLTALFGAGAIAAHAAPLPTDLKLTVTANGETQTLNLHKRTARTSDCVFYTWDSTNGYQVIATPEVRTFRGTVTENPNALIIASIDASNKLTAYCFDRAYSQNTRWTLNATDVSSQLTNPQVPAAMPSQTVADPRSGSTGTPKIGLKVPTGTSPGGVPYGKIVEHELGIDLFVAAYNRGNQNVDSTIANYEVEALVNEQMMLRDCLIREVYPVVVVRKETFYPNEGDNSMLGPVRTEWNKEPLVSKRWDNVWGSEGGVAAGGIGRDESSTALGAIYHENTHNWGAAHLGYQGDTMGGNKPSVGPVTADPIRAKRKQEIDAGTLPVAQAYTDPMHPYTSVDAARTSVNTAIDIDVLANDMDANGDVLTVTDFTTTTVPGGTVTLNPDGTLHYVPPTGFEGKDVIVYSARDNSTMQLKTREVVHIEVMGSGLRARYPFDETTGTTSAEASGGPIADLNGNNFSTASVSSPLGRGVRAWGYQGESDTEDGQRSGIILGANTVMPVPLLPLAVSRDGTPFETIFNTNSGAFDPMDASYTFATWYRADKYGPGGEFGGYVATKWWDPEWRLGWDLQVDNKQLTVHWRNFNGTQSAQALVAPAFPFKAGGWYHLATVFDRTANEIRLYVNGVKVATKTSAFVAGAVVFNGRASLCLGTYREGETCYDDTRIYAKALTDAELQALFSAAGTGTPRLLESSLTVTAIAGNPLLQSIASGIWDGGETNPTYTLLSGPSWLGINANGELTGTPGYDSAATNTALVRFTDSSGDSVELPVTINVKKRGAIARYYKKTDGSIASLTSLATYPQLPDQTLPLANFETPVNASDKYGIDARAWVVPPVSGNYTFWIAADDLGELWLSTDERPENATKIAYLDNWVGVNNWTSYASQQSVTIPLVAGHRYFLKALMVEKDGGDHLEVAWSGPGINRQVIPEANLLPYAYDASKPLFAHWKMDETGGTTVTDSSGNGNNGTLVGTGNTWVAAGQIGRALQITGTTSNVQFGKPDVTGAWTAAMWVKRASNSVDHTMLLDGPTSSLRLEQWPNVHKVGITKYGDSNPASNYAMPVNTWTHLAYVCNGVDTRLYVNGVLEYTFNMTIACPMNTLGRQVYSTLDDVRVYKGAFDAATVLALFQNNLPAQSAPVARPDAFAGTESTATITDPLLNDTDVDGDVLSVQSFTQGAHGTVTQNGIYLNYTPAANWFGTDSFTYVVSDGKGNTATQTITVNIAMSPNGDGDGDGFTNALESALGTDPSNSASKPGTIYSGLRAWWELDDASGTVADDTTGRPQDGTLLNSPLWGTGLVDGAVTFNGTNQSIQIPSLGLNSNTVTISTWVKRNGSQSPWAALVFDRNNSPSGLGFGDANELRYHWNDNGWSFNSNLIVPDNTWTFCALVIEPTKTTFYMKPLGGTLLSATTNSTNNAHNFSSTAYLGQDSMGGRFFKGSMDDVHVYSRALNPAEITELYDTAIPQAPVFTGDPITKPAAAEDAPYTGQTLAGSATDADWGDTLSYSKVSGPAWLNVASNGALTGTPANANVGANSFTVRVIDSGGLTDDAVLNIAVNNANDAPVFAADPMSGGNATEDSVYSGSLAGSASDIDAGDTLTYSKVSGPSWLTIASNGALGGTPGNGDVGPNSFAVRVTDGGGLSDDAVFNVTVTNVNDAPVFTADPITGPAATEDTAYTGSVASSANDIDAGETLTFTKVSGPIWLTVSANGNLSGTPSNANVGSNSFTVRVTDGTGAFDEAVLNIAVANVNDAPVFTVDPITRESGTEEVAYSGTSLAGIATDVDAGDSVSYSKVSGPAWLSVASNGALSGTPPAGGAGGNAFVVRATDGLGAFDEAALTITIVGPTLPFPWDDVDVGTGIAAGSATHSSGIYTVAGAGGLGTGFLNSKNDAFHFVWQTLTGDGEISAKISSLQATGTNSRVGVMIRDTLASNSRHVFMGMTDDNDYCWVRRTSNNGNTSTTSSSTGTVPNTWVRLVRVGNTITAYKSSNGTTWTQVGSLSASFPANCYVGLVTASGTAATLNTSQFSNVSLTP